MRLFLVTAANGEREYIHVCQNQVATKQQVQETVAAELYPNLPPEVRVGYVAVLAELTEVGGLVFSLPTE